MFDWIKKHKIIFSFICIAILFMLFGVPFLINLLYKVDATVDIFAAEWSAGEALSYYGAILSFIGTVVLGALALYQNHIIKVETDKKAALLEEQERIENMPRFFIRFLGASGYCGKLKFALMNVSNNMAYDVEIYDMKIKNGNKTVWETEDTYSSPAINPQKHIEIQTMSPASNEKFEMVLFATMSCNDKYRVRHEYLIKIVCKHPNNYGETSIVEI